MQASKPIELTGNEVSNPPEPSVSPIIPEAITRGVDPVVHLTAARLETLHGDMQEIKMVQKEMAAAFSKLILIEERQTNTAAAQERLFKLIERLEAKLEAHNAANRETCQQMERRLDALEAASPTYKRATDWVYMAVIGLIALIAPRLIERFFG